MSQFAGDNAAICAVFLRRSRAYLADGQLLQASEKGWGAAAHAVKLFADHIGASYNSHRQFNALVTILQRAAGETRAAQWGNSANTLHRNYYTDRLNAQQIAAYLNDVVSLVNLIRQTTGLPPVDG